MNRYVIVLGIAITGTCLYIYAVAKMGDHIEAIIKKWNRKRNNG